MPRTQNLNTYHYRVSYVDKDTDANKELQKYFKTAKEACDYFNISKSTFYSYNSTNNSKETRRCKSNKMMKTMVKLENPLPVYEKIMVHFD
tara:strand:- start:862 stop:1134 length:273 start_codon:yes stop_codon:yes gene_type:complete